jgi:protein phosphatase
MNPESSVDTAEHPKVDDLFSKHFGPSPPPMSVQFAALSHPGKVRANNEDHFLVYERRRSRKVLLTNVPAGTLSAADDVAYVYAVADGMGGAAFGELASMLALRSGFDQVASAIKWTWIINDQEVADLKERVEIVFQQMDQALLDRTRVQPEAKGMGTTLTGVYSVGPEAFIAHVGDSRAYLYRAGKLTQLTHDHTLAQAYLDVGLPVLHRSWHHTLTNCLGAGKRELRVEFHHLHLSDGDQLLLCTDGLTDMVPDAETVRVLEQHTGAEQAVQSLVDLALERGGRDNVTVVLAQYATQVAGSSL